MYNLKQLFSEIINLAILDIVLDTRYKKSAERFMRGEDYKRYISFIDFVKSHKSYSEKQHNSSLVVIKPAYNNKLDEYLNKLIKI